jgi:hypothetical protein
MARSKKSNKKPQTLPVTLLSGFLVSTNSQKIADSNKMNDR